LHSYCFGLDLEWRTNQFLSPSLLEFTQSSPAKVLDDICEQEFDIWLANLPELPATEDKNIADTENDMLTGTSASGLSVDSNFAVVSSEELLDRFLREKGKCYSILKGRKFATSIRVLNGKAMELRKRGYGKKKHKSDALTAEKE